MIKIVNLSEYQLTFKIVFGISFSLFTLSFSQAQEDKNCISAPFISKGLELFEKVLKEYFGHSSYYRYLQEYSYSSLPPAFYKNSELTKLLTNSVDTDEFKEIWDFTNLNYQVNSKSKLMDCLITYPFSQGLSRALKQREEFSDINPAIIYEAIKNQFTASQSEISESTELKTFIMAVFYAETALDFSHPKSNDLAINEFIHGKTQLEIKLPINSAIIADTVISVGELTNSQALLFGGGYGKESEGYTGEFRTQAIKEYIEINPNHITKGAVIQIFNEKSNTYFQSNHVYRSLLFNHESLTRKSFQEINQHMRGTPFLLFDNRVRTLHVNKIIDNFKKSGNYEEIYIGFLTNADDTTEVSFKRVELNDLSYIHPYQRFGDWIRGGCKYLNKNAVKKSR